ELEIIVQVEIITREPFITNLRSLIQERNVQEYKNKLNNILNEARDLAAKEHNDTT
ncbi:24202_t:CDS:1, partial [Racocetra persica]